MKSHIGGRSIPLKNVFEQFRKGSILTAVGSPIQQILPLLIHDMAHGGGSGESGRTSSDRQQEPELAGSRCTRETCISGGKGKAVRCCGKRRNTGIYYGTDGSGQ